MRTIGELLKKRREQLEYSLESVEKELRIRQKYLAALEENDFDKLPSASYIKGFVRNYSRFLGLDEKKVLAVFRRQFNRENTAKIVPAGVTRPLDEPLLKITPQRAALVTAIILVILFILYLFTQAETLLTSPP